MDAELQNKIFVVTGASSGIGRSVCVELSRQGANVALIARNEPRLAETIHLMVPGSHACFRFDVSKIADISSEIDDIHGRYGRVDGLVHCAGLGGTARLRDTVYECCHALMLVNYYAFIEFVRCLIKKKPKSQAMRIVGISSLASTTTEKYMTAYGASKAAMEAAVRCLAAELLPRNTTVNAVRPAFVDTPMVQGMNDLLGDFNEHIKSTGYQPQGLIQPEDVAKLATYLLTDAAHSITGVVVPINAGAAC